MKALIIASGAFSKKALLLAGDKFFTICADGGYDHAKKYKIAPDVIIGDMDSVKSKTEEKTIVFPTEKNETDSELAIDYAVKQGFSDLVLAGFTGTRLDHTLNNIFLLKTAHKKGARAVIIDDNNEIYYLEDELTLNGKCGEYFSIIPIEGDLLGVTVKDVKYPLDNETLHFGQSRGISNEFLNDRCTITIKSGKAIVIKSID